MSVQSGEVACPRCHEDRVSLIHEITDPMGKRYYCCVCGYEFKQGSERVPDSRHTMRV